ncbi:MAG: hypothetical protein Q7J75_01355, partial [Rhodoferax sp.]|nr:hypothetical protein [Rhodoferax sp.]
MKTTYFPRHLAALNDLSLKSLQAPVRPLKKSPCPADPAVPGTGPQARSVVELTVGVNPRQLVDKVLAEVSSWQLREFLRTVVTEPEVELALTTPIPMA